MTGIFAVPIPVSAPLVPAKKWHRSLTGIGERVAYHRACRLAGACRRDGDDMVVAGIGDKFAARGR